MARATTTAEADARLVSKSKDVNVPGFTLVRMWPFIDATYADTLGTTLDAVATYSGPQADGQTYSGTFVNSKVVCDEGIDDNNQRYVNIVQTLILVTTISSVSDLPSDPLVLQRNTIHDVHGIRTGEEDFITYEYRNLNSADTTRKACMDISDANLQALANVAGNSPATGWIYEDRQFDENANKTGVFKVLFKKVVWQIWGHDSYAADITERSNVGTDSNANNAGETISITKTWLRIRKADLSTAESDCRNNAKVAPETGYIITAVGISDNRDGSITVTQRQVKQINAVNESGSIQLNPHGINSGTTTNVITVYKNFQVNSLPAGTSVTAGGNVISNIPSIQGDGLWSREVVTRVPTWDKTWADKLEMTEVDAGGYRNHETSTATGIAASAMDAAYAAAKVASDAEKRVVVNAQQMERANGERVVTRTEAFASVITGTTDMIVTRITKKVGRGTPAVMRTWWRRTAAAKDILITVTTGEARKDFVYETINYYHTDVTVDDNGDGTFNVHQLGTIPDSTAFGLWGLATEKGEFSYSREKDNKTVTVQHLRIDDYTKAYTFAASDSGTYLKPPADSTRRGADSGWQTGVWRRGSGMFFACRVYVKD